MDYLINLENYSLALLTLTFERDGLKLKQIKSCDACRRVVVGSFDLQTNNRVANSGNLGLFSHHGTFELGVSAQGFLFK